jgi:hypothetical protein
MAVGACSSTIKRLGALDPTSLVQGETSDGATVEYSAIPGLRRSNGRGYDHEKYRRPLRAVRIVHAIARRSASLQRPG